MKNDVSHFFESFFEQAARVVLDKEVELRLALTCILAGGHLLIEDVPGVGKTTLVQTIGSLSGLDTRRIQFTIDLLPADILGSQTFHPVLQKFEFHRGPLFSQLVMADELNRASPRTQSALLQAMEEATVSLDGQTYQLPRPFHVIATQNPHHQLGTFMLPESQLDRFMMSLELHFASRETEIALFQQIDPRLRLEHLQALLSVDQLLEIQSAVQKVLMSEKVATYVADLLKKSREPGFSGLALSTRAGLALTRAAKAWAFTAGRDYVRPSDVQAVLIPVLGHRLGGNHGLRRGREWALGLQNETSVPI